MLFGRACRLSVAGFLFTNSGPLAAHAATVSARSGEILISRGAGFEKMTGQAELAPGGQVLVQQGGSATIAYAGNCTVRVVSGVWVVQEKSPCPEGTTEIDFTGRMNQQQSAEVLGVPVTGLIVGGAIATGIGVAIYNAQKDKRPTSP